MTPDFNSKMEKALFKSIIAICAIATLIAFLIHGGFTNS